MNVENLFSREWALRRHSNEIHSGFRFIQTCPERNCRKTFYRKFFLVQHLVIVHKYVLDDAKLAATSVHATGMSADEMIRKKKSVINLHEYSDISEDEFNFEELTGTTHSTSQNHLFDYSPVSSPEQMEFPNNFPSYVMI